MAFLKFKKYTELLRNTLFLLDCRVALRAPRNDGTWGILGFVLSFLSIAYPALIYFCVGQIPAYWIMGMICGLRLLHSWYTRDKNAFYITLIIAVLILLLSLWNFTMAPMYYPVLMSLAFAAMMGLSLIYPPSMIERFARLKEPQLDANGVRYTRNVTLVWFGFCLINASIALWTVILDDRDIWLLYNGCISYILMGLLMTGEYIVRRHYRAKWQQ